MHHPFPVYLGITLDRTLSFKEDVTKHKGKLESQTSLLSKLTSTKWGADPKTLRQTALALCNSTGEYCAPVWARSCLAHKIDAELNKAYRIITGALKPTPLPALYRITGIPPPYIRRKTITKFERHKQLNDPRHSLFGHQEVRQILKSRKSFTTVEVTDPSQAASHRRECWQEYDNGQHNEALPDPEEKLPPGSNLKRKEWATLNRARAKVGKTKDNLHKWGLDTSPNCQCGETHTMKHILLECRLGPHCSDKDLKDANDTALIWVKFWCDKL
ncbi:hypothetical protein Pcinc_010618 [Petrolisthes cinctipes]|uniref:Reverse transcriptase n=1 Tax=Petrolisthes cinctipes TaxID=88211 RepID=A0AAE1G505_PETCI|nr:hypothetical protein Pcinc_010618 [Petrolisthes cinctipes]